MKGTTKYKFFIEKPHRWIILNHQSRTTKHSIGCLRKVVPFGSCFLLEEDLLTRATSWSVNLQHTKCSKDRNTSNGDPHEG